MKKFLFGCALAVSGLATPFLSAQDYCCPPPCDPCCYGTDFNGLYIGGNIGVFSHTAHRNDLDGFLTDNSGWSTIETNFMAGLQLGYDWQCCSSLFGFVVDWNWTNIDRRVDNNPNATVDSFINHEFHWFTTIRARAGITVSDALFYLTAGAAVAHFDNRWLDVVDDFNHHHTRWGWTGGVGTEFLLGCNWSLGAEVLFLQFSDHVETFTSAGGVDFSFGHSDSAWLGRITLNYRFGDLCF
jgi:outer membrane immunogenic protein